MIKPTVMTSAAALLLFCGAAAMAQRNEQRDQPTAPSQQRPDSGKDASDKGPGPGRSEAQQKQAPSTGAGNEKSAQEQVDRKDRTKGTAQTRPEGKAEPKARAAKGAEPANEKQSQGKEADRAPRGKGTAEKAPEPKAKGQDKAATSGEPNAERGRSNAGNTTDQPAAGGKAAQRDGKNAQTGVAKGDGKGDGKVRISEQQRSTVRETLFKDRKVNRANNVNITVNVGSRLPRSVRLAALPASVVSIVPAYRSYQYVIVNERIVIVEPATYEVVEVLDGSSTRVTGGGRGGRLTLTRDEQAIVLREIEVQSRSTLGLGALTVGAGVPASMEVQRVPARVVEKVPKLRNYRYFTAESRVAIVDPEGRTIEFLVEEN